MSFVKLENAVKQYGNGENAVYALNDVSLEIEPKEIVVILGSSGSGKSTLLNILGGIDVMSKGVFWFTTVTDCLCCFRIERFVEKSQRICCCIVGKTLGLYFSFTT